MHHQIQTYSPTFFAVSPPHKLKRTIWEKFMKFLNFFSVLCRNSICIHNISFDRWTVVFHFFYCRFTHVRQISLNHETEYRRLVLLPVFHTYNSNVFHLNITKDIFFPYSFIDQFHLLAERQCFHAAMQLITKWVVLR